MLEPAPDAAGEPIGALQAGDAGLDAGAKISKFAINPAALDHILDLKAALFVEGHVTDAIGLGLAEIGAARKSAIGGRLSRRSAEKGIDAPASAAVAHYRPGCPVRYHIEDQAAPAGDKVELMAVACIAAAFNDDIGMRLEQADEFSQAGTCSPFKTRRSLCPIIRSISGR